VYVFLQEAAVALLAHNRRRIRHGIAIDVRKCCPYDLLMKYTPESHKVVAIKVQMNPPQPS